MVDLFTADLNTLSNDQLYAAIAELARLQPNESNRHDFKQQWNDDTLKDVAAFANTFGGILIIGVSKGKKDTAATAVGVVSNSELTTGIASSIATNISPNPSFNVVECHRPGDPNCRFAVITIRNDSTLHLVTKKSIGNPVFFRNVDETKPADAAQLRMMIDREKQNLRSVGESVFDRVDYLFSQMRIGVNYLTPDSWPNGTFAFSDTALKLALIPSENKVMRLDLKVENEFLTLLNQNYRRVRSMVGKVALDGENRSSAYYEYRWYHRSVDHEARWRITRDLEIAHVTQVREKFKEEWSLVDVVIYAILMLKMGAQWWASLKYFGEGVLVADLSVPRLAFARGAGNQFVTIFAPGSSTSCGMRSEILEAHPLQPSARATVSVNFSSMRDEIPYLVTSIMNSVLRSLGHAVSWEEFKDNVSIVMQQCA